MRRVQLALSVFSVRPSACSTSRTCPRAPTIWKAMSRDASSPWRSCSILVPARSMKGEDERPQIDGPGIRRRADSRQHFLQDAFRIDIKQRGLRAECDHAGEGLDVRMPHAVGIAAGSRQSTEEGDVRLRGARQQQEDRGDRRQQNALQNPEQQHRDQCDRRGIEIHPADPPHAHQHFDIDHLVDGGEDDGRQHGLWQVAQESGEEEQADGKRNRADDQRQRRFGACLIVDGGLRQSACNRIAMAKRHREIGGSLVQEAPVGHQGSSRACRQSCGPQIRPRHRPTAECRRPAETIRRIPAVRTSAG